MSYNTNNYNQYIESFVIGSSFPVFVLFFYGVLNLKNRNFSYEDYTFKAPLYFGILNVLSLYIGNKFGLSLQQRLFITSLISSFYIISTIKKSKAWNFKTEKRWYLQYILVFLSHLFTFNVIIYFLELRMK